MGHWCRVCDKIKSNESFSGKGHKNHICKKCSQKPKEEIANIEQTEEIFNFMNQSHITERNIGRLEILINSTDKEISELASIVLEVAKVKPYKKGRLKLLATEHGELFLKVKDSSLIVAHHW